jgi:putative endonuclease
LIALVNAFPLDPASHSVKGKTTKGKTTKGKITKTVGFLAEDLVAQWLLGQGWDVLQRRWHCRWGELDLVVKGAIANSKNTASASQFQPILAFVEVKARSRGNWDNNGLLAITPKKQAKLWQAAQLFLAEQPDLAELPCRFDVALVSYWRSPIPKTNPTPATPVITAPQQLNSAISTPVQLGHPTVTSGYRMVLQQYIQAAFD